MSDSHLQGLVIGKCRELGDAKAAEYFGVSASLVRQWVNGSKTPSLASVEKVFVLPETPPVEANWKEKEVFLALPAYKSVHPATLFTLLAMWDRPKMGFRTRFNDAFIIHARETLAADFLSSKMPICVTLDDDMVWPCGQATWLNETTGFNLPEKFAGLHMVNQLRSRKKSLVGGLYFGRNRKGRAMYHEAMQQTPEGNMENARAHDAPMDECKPTEWVGTGGLLFTRDVLLDIMKTHPHLAPQHPAEPFHFFTNSADGVMKGFTEMQQKAAAIHASITRGETGPAGAVLADLMNQMTKAAEDLVKHNRLQQGEDQLFCRRATVAGHQPYVDLALVGAHIGFNAWGPSTTER